MDKILMKKITKWLVVIAILALFVYGGYMLYKYIMANLFASIAKGIVSGVGKEIASPINLFK